MLPERYLDDFDLGERFVSPGITVTEAEIIEFALKYDPQSFHLDAPAAAASHYGGLIASGFHTLALGFRMFIQSGVFAACSMGSPGIDELRWVNIAIGAAGTRPLGHRTSSAREDVNTTRSASSAAARARARSPSSAS